MVIQEFHGARRDYFRAGTLPRRVHDLSELLKRYSQGGSRDSSGERRLEALGFDFSAHTLFCHRPPRKFKIMLIIMNNHEA